LSGFLDLDGDEGNSLAEDTEGADLRWLKATLTTSSPNPKNFVVIQQTVGSNPIFATGNASNLLAE
jgi:hypothetical protein